MVAPKQLGPGCDLEMMWLDVPSKYRQVWLEVCKPNKNSCGGSFPMRNDGLHVFKPDASMAGKNWIIKVYTKDKKCIGFSNKFFIDGMLPSCN